MKIEEIVDFVLKFHNCHRQYEVFESFKNGLETLEDQKKVIRKYNFPEQCITDTSETEHGITSETEKESYRKNLPCELSIISSDTDKFQIIIFPSYWKKTMIEQIRVIIHEARHIVDFPQILKPNKDLDYSLLKEFLKTREPSERKAILKKELRDLNLNPNLLS